MFDTLRLHIDSIQRSAAVNMAIDEALLDSPEPALRFYGWEAKTVSLGYFTPLCSAGHSPVEHWDKVRRWTGGGIVYHDGAEITYSLAAPAAHAAAKLKSGLLYRRIHEALAAALVECGIPARLAGPSEMAKPSCACFEHPVLDDVLDITGAKIAGAAQRRGRIGFLQQGSIRVQPETGFVSKLATAFAARLSLQVKRFEKMPDSPRIEELAGKYRSPEWLARF